MACEDCDKLVKALERTQRTAREGIEQIDALMKALEGALAIEGASVSTRATDKACGCSVCIVVRAFMNGYKHGLQTDTKQLSLSISDGNI